MFHRKAQGAVKIMLKPWTLLGSHASVSAVGRIDQ
jgi:hypothetical protein